MARGPDDLLQLLANPTNRSILSVLSVEPQYPRRLAELVGLTEDEASRRLRSFAKLGLAEAEWANLGKTVRLYRLASRRLTVQVTPDGLTVAGLPGEKRIEVEAARELPPALPRFVGRAGDLQAVRALLEARKAVCLHGIGGVGKTTLAAAFAGEAGRPVAWHTVAPSETPALLLGRLAANQRALEGAGERAQRLLALAASEDVALLGRTVAESVNGLGNLVVLDRFEVAAEGAGETVAGLVRALDRGRLLMTARAFPRDVPRDAVASFGVDGLPAADAGALLDAIGLRLPPERRTTLLERTRGHPLSLVLAALALEARPDLPLDRLVEESGIREFLMESVFPQLAEPERESLLALAAFREPFTVEEAEAVTERKHVAHALLRLEARGLVSRSGSTYQLHDLVRAVAADAIPSRKAVHGRVARVLRASGEPAKVLEAMTHYAEAGAVRDALDLVTEEATKRTYRFADLGLARRYREALLRLTLQPPADAVGRATVDLELGVLDTLDGDSEAAAQRLGAAEAGLRRVRGPLAVRVRLARARLAFAEGRLEEAAATYRAATEAAGAAQDEEMQLEALVDHAFCEEVRSDEDAMALYERAMQLGQRTKDIRLLSLVYAGASRISSRSGDARLLAWAEEGMRLARMAGYLRGEASVYMTLTTHTLVTGQHGRGREFAERYLELATRLGDPWLKLCALSDQTYVFLVEGRYEEARSLATEFLGLAHTMSSDFYQLHAATCIAEADLHLGRAAAAKEILAPALRAGVKAWPLMNARAWQTMSRVEEALGDADAAAQAAARSAAIAREGGVNPAWTGTWLKPTPAAEASPNDGPARAARPRRTRGTSNRSKARPGTKGGRRR